ncbi:MAG: ParB/Srx family N-terminal domain-containing protein, partial [bacterium]
MGLEIRYVPVGALSAYDRNPRTHPEQQIAQIAASIAEFGFASPIVTDGRHTIIAGHGRWLAAQRLGLTEIPV